VSAWTPRALGEYLAQRDPQVPALVTPTARLSYGELLERAMHAAGGLHALGVGHGDHVGLLMGNDEHWLATFYGAALLGAVTVPVNTRFKAAELEYCLRKADCRALVYAPRFLGNDYEAMLADIRPRLTRLVHAVRTGELAAAPMPPGGPAPEDLLLIQFTSGTTAYPKGVMLTHDSMLRNAFAAGERIGVRADDRYFNCRPFFHVGGSTLSALACLVHGACLVTLPTFEAGAALEWMEKERCTLTSGNDTIFQLLLGHPDFPKRKLRLRGGWAAAGPQTMRRIVDELGAKEICAAYGLSEASPNVVMSDWREPEDLRVRGLPTPLPELQLRTVENEIQVRGWSVMRGYYNDPEATAQAFTEDGWLRTGDLGELQPGGRLKWIGRTKDVFRVGGENVAPAEVEEALLAHPAVLSAQVVGVPDARLGEVPCAYVTLKPGAAATREALIAWAKDRLANFRVPRYLGIVDNFETIGMTASGKVQKSRLREHAIREFNL
jgi:fatty-acyl-CoA synthase